MIYRGIVILLASTVMSACSSLGDLQVFNDLGPTGVMVSSGLRTIDSSCKVLSGHSCDVSNVDSAQANRTYGEAKQLPYYRNASLPDKIAEIKQFW